MEKVYFEKKTKKKVTYTLDKKVLESFNSFCEERGYVKSKVIEKLIFDFVKNEKKL